MKILLGMVCWCLLWNGHTLALSASLQAGFRNPPDSARPWVYWFVMDGNFTREGITADFEAMKRAGIGGVIFMEVNAGIPRGPVEFMSPAWRQLFQHAVAESERLGLQITLNAGPGWTGSGGPWVKPGQSMQHVVTSELEVDGPVHFDGVLPQASPRKPYFGDEGLPPDMLRAQREFYADVAVLALPRVSGSNRIADIDEKALYLRHPYSSRPGTKPFIPAPAAFPAVSSDSVILAEKVIDLSSRLLPDGRLKWDVPAGRWTILRFGRTSTGANTRPAPAPGLGLESDKFDPAALDAHYDAFLGALLRQVGKRKLSPDAGWNMLHIDSWEMGAQNWTANFREEFQHRRGYDPLLYLPVVTGRIVGGAEISERFLWDLRQTAQELVIEKHARHLKQLGRRDGFGLSIEPYDMNPCADLSLGAVADVPMCEFWLYGFSTFFSVFEASSIAHTCGRPIVAAEAFTSTDAERWFAHPASMKTLGDWAFCAGVNRIVFHRYQHQPRLDQRPGMTMGPYGVHWERTQTWWDMAETYHRYLARCQFLLRQGLPVADVCFLSAEGAPHVFRAPSSATRGTPPDRLGYNFDGIAPETLLERMKVKDGRLVLPDGMSYRVLVLPDHDTMTPGLLRKVRSLLASGATVVGLPPKKSPSLSGYPACDDEVRRLAAEVWGDPNPANPAASGSLLQHSFGKGRVIWPATPANPVSHEPAGLLAAAKWIWHPEGNPASSAPVGIRYFRRSFQLEAAPTLVSARVTATADNDFELWINQEKAIGGANFHEAVSRDVTSLLHEGANLLAVRAANGGESPNPAGLVVSLRLRFSDGSTRDLVSDSQWETATSAPADWQSSATAGAPWQSALELGPLGMAPWGQPGSGAEPEQYGDFKVVERVLQEMGVKPDFASDVPLRYIHRTVRGGEIYFVANGQDQLVNATCSFRVSGKRPFLWDPATGETRPLPRFTENNGLTSIPLRFEPTQSWFIVFLSAKGPATGLSENFPTSSALAEVKGPWQVTFDPKWGGPEKPITMTSLQDWSTRPEEGVRYFSGTVVYRTSFTVASLPTPSNRILLSLGAVKNLARVRLNGLDLGVVWCPPWQVEATRALKPGDNHLEITVANLWPNRLIGDQGLPPEKRLTSTTWNPFAKDSALLPSGLLGPVTLTTSPPD